MEFLKNSIVKIWEGILQNVGVLITAFVVSGGYLVAISELKEFQATIREIPSDYFLTPLVLLLVIFAVLLRITRNQQHQLSKLKQVPEKDEREAAFFTHLGVWWKIYTDSEYIEDFPYCACCEPRVKLVQTDWHPDEVFKCPNTDTEYKLFDRVPREKEQVLDRLYRAYFHELPHQFRTKYFAELRREQELNPEADEADITRLLFELEPLSFMPDEECRKIIDKYPNPLEAFHFIEENFISYKKYFKKKSGSVQ